jgi:hypothetical protein
VFYRLKITAHDGKIQYSNVLHFRLDRDIETELAVFPTMVQSSATVQINSKERQSGMLIITDMSGKVVKKNSVTIQQGSNNLVLDGLDQFQRGNYIVSLSTTNQKLSRRIIVQ